MNAQQLFKESGESTNAWFCGQCGIVGYDKDAAEQCCVPHKCKTCGKEERSLQCNDCFKAEQTAKEVARFEKAEKVTEWDGWVYSDGLGYKDGFFESIGDLEDYLADQPAYCRPEYIWTCQENQFVAVDEDSIYENIENDGYEDFNRCDLNGTTELEAALRAFEKANEGILSYEPDYSKAVIFASNSEPQT